VHTTTSGVVGYETKGRKLQQLPDRQLQIADGNYERSTFHFCPKLSEKLGICSQKCCIFGSKFSDEKKIYSRANFEGPHGAPCHDAINDGLSCFV